MRSILNHYQVDTVKSILTPLEEFFSAISGKKNEDDTLKFFMDLDFPRRKSDITQSYTLKWHFNSLYGMQAAFYLDNLKLADQCRMELEKYKQVNPTYTGKNIYMSADLHP